MLAIKERKVTLARGDVLKLAELIREHMLLNEEFCGWVSGFSDNKIAETFNAVHNTKLNHTHVASLRRTIYGKFRHPEKETPAKQYTASLQALVESLADRVLRLEKEFGLDKPST